MATEKRLIDANALQLEPDPWGGMNGVICLGRSGGKTMATVQAALKRMIDNAPTVDAVEVVHAHWEDGCAIHNGKEVYKSIDCSHCNEIFKTDDREYWKARFKVCPFCGAIMDGGNEGG